MRSTLRLETLARGANSADAAVCVGDLIVSVGVTAVGGLLLSSYRVSKRVSQKPFFSSSNYASFFGPELPNGI